jgi:hypothetical protein
MTYQLKFSFLFDDHSLPGYGVDEFQIFGMQIKAFCFPSIKLVSYDRAV